MPTEELVEIVLDIDLNKEPECGERLHETDTRWHGGPATHWFRGPHGHRGLVCSKWVAAVQFTGGANCHQCHQEHDASEFTFIQI